MGGVSDLIEAIQSNPVPYAGGAVIVVVALAVLYRFSAPLVARVLGLAFLFAVIHVVVCTVLRLGNWFRESTRMTEIEAEASVESQLTAPYIIFWNWDLYNPRWIAIGEVCLVVVITFVSLWLWPLGFSRRRRKQKKGLSETQQQNRESFMSGSALSKSMMERTQKNIVFDGSGSKDPPKSFMSGSALSRSLMERTKKKISPRRGGGKGDKK